MPLYMSGGGALKAPYLPKGTPTPKAQWIDQKLDHFGSGKNDATWKQKYFMNYTWWDKANGPVFFLLGGEGPADPAWIVANTNIMINAKIYKALVFSIEHRYYYYQLGDVEVLIRANQLLSAITKLAPEAVWSTPIHF